MAAPASKADLLAAITTTSDKLVTDLSHVPLDRARESTLDGHAAGTCSASTSMRWVGLEATLELPRSNPPLQLDAPDAHVVKHVIVTLQQVQELPALQQGPSNTVKNVHSCLQ